MNVFEMDVLEHEDIESIVNAFGLSGYEINRLGDLEFGTAIGGNQQLFKLQLQYYEAQNRPINIKLIVTVKGLRDVTKMMDVDLPFHWNEDFIDNLKSNFCRGTTFALVSMIVEARGFENKRDCKNWYLETNEERLVNTLRRICKKVAIAKNVTY